jgi:peptidoglycan/xylan/chitin deacetylase (PgdA/CDA1 family)
MSILCYHSIDPVWDSLLSVRPDQFTIHCAWLARNRTVVALTEAARRVGPSGGLPPGMASLTFDDGFEGLFDHAFSIVMRHGFRPTIFLVADALASGNREAHWLKQPSQNPVRTLSLDQILEMRDAGLDFGSHSYRHLDLTSLTEAECQLDLKRSKEILEDFLKRPVKHLAYPRGLHDAQVRQCAERAGFSYAFGTTKGRERVNRYAIPRVGIYPRNGKLTVRLKTSPWYLKARRSKLFPALVRGFGRACPGGNS